MSHYQGKKITLHFNNLSLPYQPTSWEGSRCSLNDFLLTDPVVIITMIKFSSKEIIDSLWNLAVNIEGTAYAWYRYHCYFLIKLPKSDCVQQGMGLTSFFHQRHNIVKWTVYVDSWIYILNSRVTLALIRKKLNEPYFFPCFLLSSTKKFSSLKKILSTLSIAVVFGVTWILAYFMLTNNEDIRIIFSYIFCLLNTTQVWCGLVWKEQTLDQSFLLLKLPEGHCFVPIGDSILILWEESKESSLWLT